MDGPRRDPWATPSGGKKKRNIRKKTEEKMMRQVETNQWETK